MSGFISDRDLIEESSRVEDLLDFSVLIDRLDDFVSAIPHSSLVGYVGKFGSGKSTAIFQLQSRYTKNTNIRWFDFDAWKYPERRELWEGFVLDIAEQLGEKKKTLKKISGDTKTGKTVGAIAQIAQAVGILPGLSFITEKFSHLFEGQPVERVFEIQEILSAMFGSLNEENIYIVVEDLDRSGDAGRFFLETLRQFIKNNLPEKRIIVIVPIGTEIYEKNEDHRASYHKVLDYVSFFQPRGIRFKRFIEEVFDPSCFPDRFDKDKNITEKPKWKEQLENWFSIALSGGLTIREVKSILRLANVAHKNLSRDGFNPDPRVILGFALLTNTFTVGNKRWIDRINAKNNLPADCPINKYLQVIAHNMEEATFPVDHFLPGVIKFIDDKKYTIPAYSHGVRIERPGEERVNTYFLSSLYLTVF